MLILVRTHAARWLVQRDINLVFGADDFAVHDDLVALRINLRPQHFDDVAVDAHQPVQNQFLARAARSHAGIREKFLQTNHGIYDLRLPIYD